MPQHSRSGAGCHIIIHLKDININYPWTDSTVQVEPKDLAEG